MAQTILRQRSTGLFRLRRQSVPKARRMACASDRGQVVFEIILIMTFFVFVAGALHLWFQKLDETTNSVSLIQTERSLP